MNSTGLRALSPTLRTPAFALPRSPSPLLGAFLALGVAQCSMGKSSFQRDSHTPVDIVTQPSLGDCPYSERKIVQGYRLCPSAVPVVEYLTAHFAGDCYLRCTITGEQKDDGSYINPMISMASTCTPSFSGEQGATSALKARRRAEFAVISEADTNGDKQITGFEALTLDRHVTHAAHILCAERHRIDPADAQYDVVPMVPTP